MSKETEVLHKFLDYDLKQNFQIDCSIFLYNSLGINANLNAVIVVSMSVIRSLPRQTFIKRNYLGTLFTSFDNGGN